MQNAKNPKKFARLTYNNVIIQIAVITVSTLGGHARKKSFLQNSFISSQNYNSQIFGLKK